ncbi:hypothetical protein OEM_24030 [Mycobacterium intracellulare subsp. yongonense 05-1390]|nr:hypothetical protein OEM_24030 [Mycobacterium intracellulare subsp. yongonense 05-1390]ARR78067.1 hypothetical protein MOTT12_02403 [Mycobacterium intracellulare subsp. yongonense]ARR83160.1 hypothetical protein MOTT27_02339 [Mycobacterium intracellulare subsp. yongonense]
MASQARVVQRGSRRPNSGMTWRAHRTGCGCGGRDRRWSVG